MSKRLRSKYWHSESEDSFDDSFEDFVRWRHAQAALESKGLLEAPQPATITAAVDDADVESESFDGEFKDTHASLPPISGEPQMQETTPGNFIVISNFSTTVVVNMTLEHAVEA